MKIKDLGDDTLISFLESEGFELENDINAYNAKGWTPLLTLLRKVDYCRNVELIKDLITKGADPNLLVGKEDKELFGQSSIRFLLELQKENDEHFDIVDILLQQRVRFSDKDINDIIELKPFYYLSYLDPQTAEKIFEKVINQKENAFQHTFLYDYGLDIIENLLKKNYETTVAAILNKIPINIHWPFILAVKMQQDTKLGIDFLKTHHININEPLPNGKLPIEQALEDRDYLYVDHLIALGVNLKPLKGKKISQSGRAPEEAWVLIIANIDLTESMLDDLLDGNYDRLSAGELTPLGAIVKSQNFNNLMKITNNNIYASDILGANAAMWMIKWLNPDLREQFKKLRDDFEFDLNSFDVYGNTPLILAIQNAKSDNSETYRPIRALIALGVDINLTNRFGDSALILAIKNNLLDIVVELLKQPSLDTFLASESGEMPLEIAQRVGNKEMIQLIRDNTMDEMWKIMDGLLNDNLLEEAKKLIKIYFPDTLPEENEWQCQENYKKILMELFSQLKKEREEDVFENDLKSIQEAVKTGVIDNTLLKSRINKVSDLFAFEKYLLAKDKILYTIFKAIQALETVRECMSLYGAGELKSAHELYKRRNCDFVEIISSLNVLRYSMQYLNIFAKYHYGNNWAPKLYEMIKNNSKCLKILGEQVNFENHDESRSTLFHEAIKENNLPVLKLLIQDRNILIKEFDNCPVVAAINAGHNDILEYLLSKGADPFYGCNHNTQKTLLDHAKNDTQKKIIEQYIQLAKEKGKKSQLTSGEFAPKVVDHKRVQEKHAAKQEFANRFGQVLGVKKVTYSNSNEDISQNVEIILEGTTVEKGFGWVAQSIQLHHEREPLNTELGIINDAYQFSQDFLSGKKDRKQLYERYHEGKAIVLMLAWHMHGLTVTLQNGWLSITNRGQGGDQQHGSKIYKIKPGVNIEEFIYNVVSKANVAVKQGFCTDDQSVQFFKNLFSEVVNLEAPFDELDQKGQKRGNCGVANPKSAIQAMHYIQQIQNSKETEEEKLLLNRTQFRKNSKEFYKAHSNFMRNTEIDAILLDIKSSHDKNINAEFYFDILTAFIMEHNDFNKKDGKEGMRICRIWEALPVQYQERIGAEINKMRNKKATPDFKEALEAFTKSKTGSPQLKEMVSESLVKEEMKTRAEKNQNSTNNSDANVPIFGRRLSFLSKKEPQKLLDDDTTQQHKKPDQPK